MAFVPLDPEFSEEYLLDILQDCETRLIVTDDKYYSLAEKLRDRTNKNIKIINVSLLVDYEMSNTYIGDYDRKEEDTAYILYMIDSFGKLKSFKQNHKSITNILTALTDCLHIKQNEKTLFFNSSDTLASQLQQIFYTLANAILLVDEPQKYENYNCKQEVYLKNLHDNYVYTDLPHKSYKSNSSIEVLSKQVVLDSDFISQIDNYCRLNCIPRVIFFLGIFNLTLFLEINQDDLSIQVPVLGCSSRENLPNSFINILTVNSKIKTEIMFKNYLLQLNESMARVLIDRVYLSKKYYTKLCRRHPQIERNAQPISFIYLTGEDGCTSVINQIDDLNVLGYSDGEFDAGLFIQQKGKGICLKFLYKENLYEDYVIVRILDNFLKVSNIALAQKDVRISDIDLLKNIDENRLLLDLDNEFENDELI